MSTLLDPSFTFTGLWWGDDFSRPPREPDWLWHGYLAPRRVTVLTSQWKVGKTTLISLLLARLGQGGTLGGLAVRPGKVAVITDEDREQWQMRGSPLRFGPNLGLLHRPFHPAAAQARAAAF